MVVQGAIIRLERSLRFLAQACSSGLETALGPANEVISTDVIR